MAEQLETAQSESVRYYALEKLQDAVKTIGALVEILPVYRERLEKICKLIVREQRKFMGCFKRSATGCLT